MVLKNYAYIKPIVFALSDALSLIDSYRYNLESKDISEIIRHSTCLALDIDSVCALDGVDNLCNNASKIIRNSLSSEILDSSLDSRRGVLEACVHCIEFSRKKVENE